MQLTQKKNIYTYVCLCIYTHIHICIHICIYSYTSQIIARNSHKKLARVSASKKSPEQEGTFTGIF